MKKNTKTVIKSNELDLEVKKREIKAYLEEVALILGKKRDDLMHDLDVGKSTFYSYLVNGEIPEKHRQKLEHLKKTAQSKNAPEVKVLDLKSVSLDDLVKEIEDRNWHVELKRKG